MTWTQDTHSPVDDVQLNLYRSKATGPLKAIVQLNHGMGEHAGRYKRFAHALSAAGYALYAHDHRGHGHTTSSDSSVGKFARKDGWKKVISDVASINALAHQENVGTPVICFGHSMGSVIAFNYAMHYPGSVAGLALWNLGTETGALGAVFKTVLKVQRMFKGSDVPSPLVKKLTFETWNKAFAPNRTSADWLSRDEAEVDKYINDPYCGFDVTIGLWLDVVEGTYHGADNTNLQKLPKNLPVHLLAGDQDLCSDKGKAMKNIEKRMSKTGMSDVTNTLLKDTRHESLNELNRDETTTQFIAWLDARFAR